VVVARTLRRQVDRRARVGVGFGRRQLDLAIAREDHEVIGAVRQAVDVRPAAVLVGHLLAGRQSFGVADEDRIGRGVDRRKLAHGDVVFPLGQKGLNGHAVRGHLRIGDG